MISVIVPIYNACLYLKDCLNSIKQQSFSDYEVICVDDGSTDNSAVIAKEFENLDSRFKLYQQENAGVSAARNLGLSKATGDYICFIDADDIVDTGFLMKLYELSKDGSFAVCSYSRELKRLGLDETNVFEYSAKEFVNRIINEIIEHPNICMMLFKNNIIKQYNLNFYVGCVRNEDAEFFLKYLLYENKVKSSNYKGYYYRPNEQSAMHVTTMKSLTCLEASKRIGRFLCDNGYTNNINIDLYPTIQSVLYHLSRENNAEIYEYLHREYDIHHIMKELINYKARRRKIISIVYLMLGKSLFYAVLSSRLANKLPL